MLYATTSRTHPIAPERSDASAKCTENIALGTHCISNEVWFAHLGDGCHRDRGNNAGAEAVIILLPVWILRGVVTLV